MPLSRTSLSDSPRVGVELFQHLLQSAGRENVTSLLALGKPGEVRSPPLDDNGKRYLVHRGIPLRNSTSIAPQARCRKESHTRRCPDDARGNARTSQEIGTIAIHVCRFPSRRQRLAECACFRS